MASMPISTSPSADSAYREWLDKLFQTVSQIGTLGAGFTFSVIVTGLQEGAGIDTNKVRYYVATSWVLFIIAVIFANFLSMLAGYWRATLDNALAADFRSHMPVRALSLIAAGVLQVLLLAAFALSARAIEAYEPGVGKGAFILIIVLVPTLLGAKGSKLLPPAICEVDMKQRCCAACTEFKYSSTAYCPPLIFLRRPPLENRPTMNVARHEPQRLYGAPYRSRWQPRSAC
jgi:hypothetical protein